MSSLSSSCRRYKKRDLVHTFEQYDNLFFEYAKFGSLIRKGGELSRWNLKKWLEAARIVPDIMSKADIPLVFALVNGKRPTIDRMNLLFFIKAAAIRHGVKEEDMLFRLVSVTPGLDKKNGRMPPVFDRLSHRKTFTGIHRQEALKVRRHTTTPIFNFVRGLRSRELEVTWPPSMTRWYVCKQDGSVVKTPEERGHGDQEVDSRCSSPHSTMDGRSTLRSINTGRSGSQSAKRPRNQACTLRH